jgi:aryl-alcohol dehydrogenase-like predicted oxidoreductase
MKKNKLGNSGLEVSNLCLGGNVFGWTADEATSFKILDAFFEAGGTFIDTADVYSRWVPGHKGGESETIIGKWMKARNNREKLVIATKVGMDMGEGGKGLSKNHILSSVEKSLQRLQTDYIDLYISHRQDDTVPMSETSETYGMLIKHGKIRVCGASNYNGEGLEKAIHDSHHNTSPAYQSLQPLYNLYDRADFEKDLMPVCKEHNLGVTPYYALASGFLTGKYRSDKDLGKSVRGGRMKDYMNSRGFKILEALDKVSTEQKTTPTAVAVAWLMARPNVTAPIASATKVEQLKELIAATQLKLSADSLGVLDKASAY